MHCMLCIVFFALYSMHCIPCIVLYALYSIHCVLCIVFYILYSLHCILCIVFHGLYYIHCFICILIFVMYKAAIAAKNSSSLDYFAFACFLTKVLIINFLEKLSVLLIIFMINEQAHEIYCCIFL